MKKQKRTVAGNLATRLGLPGEAMPGMEQVLLLGETRLRATPCLRLLRYGETEIQAKIGKRVLCICGSRLQVEVFCAQTLEVGGCIRTITWEAPKREAMP